MDGLPPVQCDDQYSPLENLDNSRRELWQSRRKIQAREGTSL